MNPNCKFPYAGRQPVYYSYGPQPGFYNPVYPSQFPAHQAESRMNIPGSLREKDIIALKDYGPQPFAVNIEKATKQNTAFRTALWTGKHLQVTLMSIRPGEDIGLEIHPELDQFIRIEDGQGVVKMGDRKDNLNFSQNVSDDFAFVIPAGKWHNLINTGEKPLKLYSIYAPPQHPFGTIHQTKEMAMAEEHSHHRRFYN